MTDNRLNIIVNKLKKNQTDSLSVKDLLFYLNSVSNNKSINENNINNTIKFINDISISSNYFDIYYNKFLYSNNFIYYLLLLLPFYLNYPRLYNAKFSVFFGLIAMMILIDNIKKTYKPFLGNFTMSFFILIFIIISLFFIIFLKKFDIITVYIIFVISVIIVNYLFRLIIPLLFKNIVPIENNNIKFTNFNDDINNAINALKKKNKNIIINDNQQFYIFLTRFNIGNNNNYISDFFTNLIQPFISILIIYNIGLFLNDIKIDDNIKLIPIIGFQENKYFDCNSNYILPPNFNIIQDKEIKENILKIYKPVFINDNNEIKMKLNYFLENLYGQKVNDIDLIKNSINNIHPIDTDHIQYNDSTKLYTIIIKLISTWILIGRSILSPLYLSQIFSNSTLKYDAFNKYYDTVKNEDNIWRYVCLGTDLSYFEDVFENKFKTFMETNQNATNFDNQFKLKSSFKDKFIRIFFIILYFIGFNFFNNSIFGSLFKPTYINLIISFIILFIFLFINRNKNK